MLTATVSGSFRRHMSAIAEAVQALTDHGVRVLSPADPRIVDQQTEFWYVASDVVRSIRLLQDRHLDSIRCSNFLWLVAPDGYVGRSASMEIGYAAGAGVPIFATSAPQDLTLKQYVSVVRNLNEALSLVAAERRVSPPDGILINPRATIEEAQIVLERVRDRLSRASSQADVAACVHRDIEHVQQNLKLPTVIH